MIRCYVTIDPNPIDPEPDRPRTRSTPNLIDHESVTGHPTAQPPDTTWIFFADGGEENRNMTEDQINQLVRDGNVIGAIAGIRSTKDLSLQEAVDEYHRRVASLNGAPGDSSAATG
jgi:hypothetical protein